MDKFISKKAGTEEALKKYILAVWKVDRGPLENIFRLIPYALIPFMGGLGSVIKLVITVLASHILGISPADFGRKLDQMLGLGPGDDPRDAGVMLKLEEYVNELVNKKATASEKYPISKTASLWTMIKAGGYAGKILVKGIIKSVAVLTSLFAFSHLGELYEEVTNPTREYVSGIIAPEHEKGDTKKVGPSDAEEFADYIEQKYGLK